MGTKKKSSKGEDQPQVFAVSKGKGGMKFSRKEILEVAGIAVAGTILTGCDGTITEDDIQTAIAKTQASKPTSTSTPAKTSTSSAVNTPTKTNTPTASFTPTPEPVAVVNVGSINFREGPGIVYGQLGYLYEGEVLEVLKRTSDNEWLVVRTADGVTGWIAVSGVSLNFPVSSLPIETNIPPTPSPMPPPTKTPSPGTLGQVEPGSTGINLTYKGQTYTLPCGSQIPADAVCTCNCVTVPAECGCNTNCTCDTEGGHYWYPN